MNLLTIAWKSVKNRAFSSGLTMLSMALGVMLVSIVLTIYSTIELSFSRNARLGYDLIVGARGASLQLTMNTVYYLSKPVENVPYEYYLAFLSGEEREEQLKNSLAYKSHEAEWDAVDSALLSLSSPIGPQGDLASALFADVVNSHVATPMGLSEDGQYENYVTFAIPVCLGDYFANFRIVGTTPMMFEVPYDIDTEKSHSFAQGRNFEHYNAENGFFECVVGSTVANKENVKIGDLINPIHGAPESKGAHKHKQAFKVVGILNPSGTPVDRAVFVNMEGFYLMNDHAKPVDEEPLLKKKKKKDETENTEDANSAEAKSETLTTEVAQSTLTEEELTALELQPLPIEQREVTAVLVSSADDIGAVARLLEAQINEGVLESNLGWSTYRPTTAQTSSQAIMPTREIESFFGTFIQPIHLVILVLSVMICIVSGISILVSIYNSMSERRQEIAVMRALGARKETIFTIILWESTIIAGVGGFIGILIAHVANVIVSPYIEEQTGVAIGLFDVTMAELLIIPGVLVLAILVGVYPAVSAYRTDVSKALAK